MAAAVFTTNCCFSLSRMHSLRTRAFCSRAARGDEERDGLGTLGRRPALVSGLSLASGVLMGFTGDGVAAVKQGLLAGRIPGLSDPDENGWRTYRRPDEKSGGHGVGWSPIIPYTFKVPQGWEEVPVSIADLGGTEIDLRFANSRQGRLFVIVAPVLRFSADLGDDAKIEQVGSPEKVVNAFGPEVIGENVEGKVLSMEEADYSGRKYYQFELEPPHVLITATAAGNRVYLFGVTANDRHINFHQRQYLSKFHQGKRVGEKTSGPSATRKAGEVRTRMRCYKGSTCN